METFTDDDGMEHKILFYTNQGTRRNFMITSNTDENGLEFPQIWESNHTNDEVPVWFQRPENKDYTVSDILSHVMLGAVAGLEEFDFYNGRYHR